MTDTPNPTWKNRWLTLWKQLFADAPIPEPRRSTTEWQALRAEVALQQKLIFGLGYHACLRGQSEEEAWRELEQKLYPRAS